MTKSEALMPEILKNLLKMSLPMACSHLVLATTTFTVMFLLAQLGGTILPASYGIAMTRLVISLTFMSTLFAFGPIISREYTDSSQQDNSVVQQGWIISLILSLLPMFLFAHVESLLTFFHQPMTLVPIISQYFDYYLWAIPAMFLSTINQQFLLGTRQQYKVLFLYVLNMLLSASLNFCLIFGYAFFPRLEVQGAGIASILTAWISFMISTAMVYKANPALFSCKKWPHFQWGKKLLKIGHPICLKTANDMMMTFMIMVMVGWLGEISMSASQISNEYVLLILMLSVGIGDASAMMVGHLLKNAEEDKLKQLAKIALLISTVPSCLGLLVFYLFKAPLIQFFINSNNVNATEIFELTVVLLTLRLVKVLLSALAQTYIGLLRGLYITTYPFWISLLTNWIILIPFAMLLSFKMALGVKGILIAGICTDILLVFSLKLRWDSLMQKKDLQLQVAN